MELMIYLCLSTALIRCPRQTSGSAWNRLTLVSQSFAFIVKHCFQQCKLCSSMTMPRGLLSLSHRLMCLGPLLEPRSPFSFSFKIILFRELIALWILIRLRSLWESYERKCQGNGLGLHMFSKGEQNLRGQKLFLDWWTKNLTLFV